jgi:hypothetical protein
MLSVHFYWSIDIMAPDAIASGHGQLALTYALGNAALISHGLHFVQAPSVCPHKKSLTFL